MKKSLSVSIPLVTTLAAAALASGCGSKPQPGWQTCVDRSSKVAVDQRYCDQEQDRYVDRTYHPRYGWYYYPHSYYWSAPSIGQRVPDGGAWGGHQFVSTPMARSGSVARGGLGSTAAGHSSGIGS